MSRHVVSLIVAFLALNIVFDLIVTSAAARKKQSQEEEPEPEKGQRRVSPLCLPLVPLVVAYSSLCTVLSYVLLVIFRTVSLFSALLKFLGLASANEGRTAMLWSIAVLRSISGKKKEAK